MKFTRSLLTLSIATLLSAPLAQAAQPALTGYDSGSTIPYSLFDETETHKPWITAPVPKKKPLRPATAENVQQKQKLAALEKSLAEQQRINQEVLAGHHVEKQQLQQQLTALTAEQTSVAEQRAQLDKLQGELNTAQNQHSGSQQELSELRMQLAAHQLLVDTQALTQSTLAEKLKEKDASLLALSQQLATLQAQPAPDSEKEITQLQQDLAAAQQQKTQLEQQMQARQQAAPESHEQKLSYANGVAFASTIVQSLRAQENLGVEPDRPMVLAGIRDAFDKRVALNSDELSQLVIELDSKLNDKLQHKQLKNQEVIQHQKVIGKKLIEQTKKRKGVKQLEGAYYVVTKVGKGKKLTAESTVDLLITGKLADGVVFDDSGIKKQRQSVKLDSLLPAITRVLTNMKQGSELDIILPPDLAFSNEGVEGLIPGGATISFKIVII